MIELWLMTGLLIKHFLFDYVFQFKYMLENKGRYLHEGGVHHAFFHGCGTAFVFGMLGFEAIAAQVFIIDTLIHYHLDYLKSKITGWYSINMKDKAFWNLLGADQLAHQLTYVLLVYLALHK